MQTIPNLPIADLREGDVFDAATVDGTTYTFKRPYTVTEVRRWSLAADADVIVGFTYPNKFPNEKTWKYGTTVRVQRPQPRVIGQDLSPRPPGPRR